ncbi:MAG: Holliday junction branch migration protein RuvA [Clostridia bacterium]|nr:Holliday junction branch migration protein RuvA [Clostridia bacterium]
MIASLSGRVIAKDKSSVVIECGGVGFKCFITENTYNALGGVDDNAFIHTCMIVKEDALDLFGFAEQGELEVFKLITSVSGVGAKIGLAILSVFNYEKVLLFIASGDAKSLTAAPGVGIKLAQRMVLELKDKVGSVASGDAFEAVSAVGNSAAGTSAKEAIEALVSLGYSQSEAALAVGRLDPSLKTDDLIRGALKTLARGI